MPREAAIRAIEAVETRRAFSNIALDAQIRKRRLTPLDAALATEITYGVLKNSRFLDDTLRPLLRRPLEKLDRRCLTALRVGAYQLLLLDRVPAHAALWETVEAVKRYRPQYTGLVNAVLRRISERIPSIKQSLERPVTTIDELALRYSFPDELAASLVERFGLDQAIEYARAVQARPTVTLRVRDPETRPKIVHQLVAQGIAAVPTPYAPSGVLITSGGPPDQLPCVTSGQALVQDEASQLVGWYADPRPFDRVADLCAGRGGKSFLLADLMDNQGEVLATDISAPKLETLRKTAERLGYSIVRTPAPSPGHVPGYLDRGGTSPSPGRAPYQSEPSHDQETPSWETIPIQDLVFLDAPCSGSGVLRRHPEIRWRLNASWLDELVVRQAALLTQAARLVRPGGHLVYAVCSDLPSEGPVQIESFLARHPEFQRNPPTRHLDWTELTTAQGDLYLLPHRHATDGFFASRLLRSR